MRREDDTNPMCNAELFDFPCSAFFRGIDLRIDDRWAEFFAIAPDECWFEKNMGAHRPSPKAERPKTPPQRPKLTDIYHGEI